MSWKLLFGEECSHTQNVASRIYASVRNQNINYILGDINTLKIAVHLDAIYDFLWQSNYRLRAFGGLRIGANFLEAT